MAQTEETDKRYLFDKQKELSERLQKVKDQATNHKVFSVLTGIFPERSSTNQCFWFKARFRATNPSAKSRKHHSEGTGL